METAGLAKDAILKESEISSNEPVRKGGGDEQKEKETRITDNIVMAKMVTEKATGTAKEKLVKAAADKGNRHIMPLVNPSSAIRPFLKQPKHIQDPEFEFIGISYPLQVIEKRLYGASSLFGYPYEFANVMVMLIVMSASSSCDSKRKCLSCHQNTFAPSMIPIRNGQT